MHVEMKKNRIEANIAVFNLLNYSNIRVRIHLKFELQIQFVFDSKVIFILFDPKC